MSWSTYGKKNSTSARLASVEIAASENTDADVSVQFLDESQPTALLRVYQGQSNAQQAFIALDLEDGQLYADYNAEIGNSVPMSVGHGRTIRWYVPALQANVMNRILREITPLAQQVLDGSEVERDGNNVGTLNDTAQDALDEIGRLLGERGTPPILYDEFSDAVFWSAAEDWFIDEDDELGEAVYERGVDAVMAECQGTGTCEASPYITNLQEYLRELVEDGEQR